MEFTPAVDSGYHFVITRIFHRVNTLPSSAWKLVLQKAPVYSGAFLFYGIITGTTGSSTTGGTIITGSTAGSARGSTTGSTPISGPLS